MGGDSGEYSGEGASSEVSFESSSFEEVSSSEVAPSEVSGAFDELTDGDVNTDSDSDVDLTTGEANDFFSDDSDIDADVTNGEIDVAFGENNSDNGENSDMTESAFENNENSDKGEDGVMDLEATETEKQEAFNENNEREIKNDDIIENGVNNNEGKEGKISETDISDLPSNVQESFHNYESERWTGPLSNSTPGTKGGGEFANRDGDLPPKDMNGNPISYKEYDVNSKPIDGAGRDGERFVVGSDGSVYYTSDHYDSFTKIK